MIGYRLISLLIGYIFGLFQTGYIYGKLRKIDIRKHGSGNAGTTNTLRTFGIKGGLVTLLGDVIKAMLSLLVVWILFHQQAGEDKILLLMGYAGLGAVIGHNFPFYLKFKGGKGIACTGGFVLAFFWPATIVPLTIFICTVVVTRYVSLGSLLGVTALFIQLVVFGQLGILPVSKEYLPELYVVIFMFAALAFFSHRQNIKRLFLRTENKLVVKKKGEIHEQTGGNNGKN